MQNQQPYGYNGNGNGNGYRSNGYNGNGGRQYYGTQASNASIQFHTMLYDVLVQLVVMKNTTDTCGTEGNSFN